MHDRVTDEKSSELSENAEQIVEQITGWYPDAGVRGQIVELMADLIEAAHSVSGRAWCATAPKSGQVKLNVGTNAILRLSGEGAVRIALSGSPSEILQRVRKVADETFPFKRPQGAIWRLKVADFSELADDLAEDVVHFAIASAESVNSTPFRRFHRDAVVEAIAHLAGRELPQPSYTVEKAFLRDLSMIEIDGTEDALDFEIIVANLAGKGLHFSEETVATYLLALQAKRFVILSGISGTGKTALALEVARSFQGSDVDADVDADVAVSRRYEVVAVRPDWTDNNGLLGFYNPLLSDYTSTPFLSLLLRARDEEKRALREQRPARAFFVILDEMNLARVEHYFSDFLSCLESGEPIVLHDDVALEEKNGGVPRTVCVPSNLFFTGTVNVDESTNMFSPKVLDRAFTLEFNEVDLDAYGDAEALETEECPLSLRQFPGFLSIREKPNPEDWGAFRGRNPELSGILADLNRVLRQTHRHFGYRVANEIARFMNLASVQAGSSPSIHWCAFDIAVLSKALPKLHGTQQELEATLLDLFKFAVDPSAGTEVRIADWRMVGGVLQRVKKSTLSIRLPRTAAKLFRMIERLRTHGFASFIE